MWPSFLTFFLLSRLALATATDPLCKTVHGAAGEIASEVVRYYSNLPSQSLELHEKLEAMSGPEINALFDRLYREDPDFAERVANSTISDYPRYDRADPFNQRIEAAVISLYSMDLNKPLFGASPTAHVMEQLVKYPGFRHWLEHQELKPGWESQREEFASDLMKAWEKETAARNTPRPANPTQPLTPDYEARFTWARIGAGEFVASKDGKSWICVKGCDRSPAFLPRYSGDAIEFAQRLEQSRKTGLARMFSGPTKPADLGSASAPARVSHPPLAEESPAFPISSGLGILENGRTVPAAFGRGAFAQPFIDEKAFGYHVTQPGRLREILKTGWLLNQKPTSFESSQMPGLHLSTHLGVTYGIPGENVVLRVVLTQKEYRAVPGSPYYGHIARDTPVEAKNVSKVIQFSPDQGITWYPLNDAMVNALQAGTLPVERAVPIP